MTELLFYQDAYLKNFEAEVVRVDGHGIVLDRTVFYPKGGGQPGDSGLLRAADGRETLIVDTRKAAVAGEVLHIPAPGSVALTPGDKVIGAIEWDRRHHHMRIHTCLHLLSAVIHAGVTGGSIRYDSGRLDFDLPNTVVERDQVEARLNELIAGGHAVTSRWVSDEELDARPELVKTMSVAPPRGLGRVRLLEIAGVDLQACGGTHVANTCEIGEMTVSRIENKGTHNRRVIVAFPA